MSYKHSNAIVVVRFTILQTFVPLYPSHSLFRCTTDGRETAESMHPTVHHIRRN